MSLSTILIMLILVPLAACLIMAVAPSKAVPQSFYESLHMVSVITVCCLSVYLVVQVFVSGVPVDAAGLWFRLDDLGAIFVTLIGVIGLLTGSYSLPYVRHDVERGAMGSSQVKQYYAFFSLFIFSMLMATTTNNIIMMWASVELTTLATVFLVGAYNTEFSLEAAWKYIIVCTAGVAFGLYGTVLVYANANSIVADPTQAVFWTSVLEVSKGFDPTLIQIAFVFAAIGFGTKAGLFPMHTWLPDAHSEAPSPVSALLSGVLLKCAMLVVIRFYILTGQAVGYAFPQLVMLVLGVVSIVAGALAVFSQNDLKRKLAYSSSENIGVVALCLGFGGPIGIAAALIHCIVHGFTKALLFCISGNVLMKYGTRDLRKITGLIKVAPTTAVLLALGLFALAGFPPFAMFTSEVMAFVSGVVSGNIVLVVIAGIALTIVVAAFAHVVATAVFGDAPEGIEKGELRPAALIPEIIMIAVVLWFGAAMPIPVIEGVENATAIVLQSDTDALHEMPIVSELFAGTSQAVSAQVE